MNTISAAVELDAATVPEHLTYALPYLRAWRRYLALPRAELARLASVSHSMIVFVESGTYRLGGRLVNQLARALDVPAVVLVQYPPNARQAQAYARRAAIRFALRRLEHDTGAGAGDEVA